MKQVVLQIHQAVSLNSSPIDLETILLDDSFGFTSGLSEAALRD